MTDVSSGLDLRAHAGERNSYSHPVQEETTMSWNLRSCPLTQAESPETGSETETSEQGAPESSEKSGAEAYWKNLPSEQVRHWEGPKAASYDAETAPVKKADANVAVRSAKRIFLDIFLKGSRNILPSSRGKSRLFFRKMDESPGSEYPFGQYR